MGKAAAKATVSATEDTVVVTLVPYPEMGSASIDSSSFAELGVKVLARSKSLMRVSVPASSLLAASETPGSVSSANRFGRIPKSSGFLPREPNLSERWQTTWPG